MSLSGELVRIGRSLPAPRLVRHVVEWHFSVEQRCAADSDAVSIAEIEGRIAGLLRLRQRCLAEYPKLLAEVEAVTERTERGRLRAEANGAQAAADGVLDEVTRLEALASPLRLTR